MSTTFNHTKYLTISKIDIPYTYYYEPRNFQPTFTASNHTKFQATLKWRNQNTRVRRLLLQAHNYTYM
jgi:hypothetical protein